MDTRPLCLTFLLSEGIAANALKSYVTMLHNTTPSAIKPLSTSYNIHALMRDEKEGQINGKIYTVLSTKRVEWVVFQSFDIFSVMVHAIETKNIPT